jgi:hypothetical protein
MSNTALIAELSDSELDEVGGGLIAVSPLTGLALNIAVLNFGDVAQSSSVNQQQASITSLLAGAGGGWIRQRMSSETEAEFD